MFDNGMSVLCTAYAASFFRRPSLPLPASDQLPLAQRRLNSTFAGVGAAGAGGGDDKGSRLADSSFLGNIAYTGDYFLRVPNASRKWIAHVDGDGSYVAVHGHAMPGTKFFT